MALGTMTWGVDTDADEATSQLVAFVDAGGTLVDTADVYADGESERILGGLLGDVVPRQDVVIATKAVARRDDGPFGGGASRGALLTALDGSLRPARRRPHRPLAAARLGPCRPDRGDPRRRRRRRGQRQGPLRRRVQLHAAGSWAPPPPGSAPCPAAPAWCPPRSSTPCWNAASNARSRRPPSTTASACCPGRRWAAACSPASTAAAPRPTPAAPPSTSPPYVEHHRTERAARIVEAVVTAADGLGTSPLAVALAWVRDRPGVVAPVVGARDTGQLTGSLATEDLTLPPAIRAALDDVSGIELGYPERTAGLDH